MSFNGSTYCGRFLPRSGCVSAILNTTISYQQVCGWVAGYQKRAPDAFQPYNVGNSPNITKFTLMGCLYLMAVLVTIYGHTRLGSSRALPITSIVHVTQEAQSRFLPTLAMTTTVSLGIKCSSLMVHHVLNIVYYTLEMSCGMDSSVVVWRLPAALTPTCHGSSKHSTRTQLTILN